MKINRDNYESWFLDYLEGNLDQEQMEMVRLFKIEHPDLADEQEEFSPFLKADSYLVYPGKHLLKKVVYDDPVHFEGDDWEDWDDWDDLEDETGP